MPIAVHPITSYRKYIGIILNLYFHSMGTMQSLKSHHPAAALYTSRLSAGTRMTLGQTVPRRNPSIIGGVIGLTMFLYDAGRVFRPQAVLTSPMTALLF